MVKERERGQEWGTLKVRWNARCLTCGDDVSISYGDTRMITARVLSTMYGWNYNTDGWWVCRACQCRAALSNKRSNDKGEENGGTQA